MDPGSLAQLKATLQKKGQKIGSPAADGVFGAFKFTELKPGRFRLTFKDKIFTHQSTEAK